MKTIVNTQAFTLLVKSLNILLLLFLVLTMSSCSRGELTENTAKKLINEHLRLPLETKILIPSRAGYVYDPTDHLKPLIEAGLITFVNGRVYGNIVRYIKLLSESREYWVQNVEYMGLESYLMRGWKNELTDVSISSNSANLEASVIANLIAKPMSPFSEVYTGKSDLKYSIRFEFRLFNDGWKIEKVNGLPANQYAFHDTFRGYIVDGTPRVEATSDFKRLDTPFLPFDNASDNQAISPPTDYTPKGGVINEPEFPEESEEDYVENTNSGETGGSVKTGVVNTSESDLRIRATPSKDGSIIGKVPRGERVVILDDKQEQVEMNGNLGRWVKIRYQAVEGWIWGNYLKMD